MSQAADFIGWEKQPTSSGEGLTQEEADLLYIPLAQKAAASGVASLTSDSHTVQPTDYTPETSADWDVVPDIDTDALDELASRVTDLEDQDLFTQGEADALYIPLTQKAAASGVAELNSSSQVVKPSVYTQGQPLFWYTNPDTTPEALDELADRVNSLENSTGGGAGSINWELITADDTIASGDDLCLQPALNSAIVLTLGDGVAQQEFCLYNEGPGIVLISTGSTYVNGLQWYRLILKRGEVVRARFAGDTTGWVIDPHTIGGWPGSMSTKAMLLLPQKGITLSASKVTTWVDQKNSFSFTQSTDANRPTLSSLAFGQQPGLTFSSAASTQLTAIDNAVWDLPNDSYIFITYKATSLTGAQDILSHHDGVITGWAAGVGGITARIQHMLTNATTQTGTLLKVYTHPVLLEYERNTGNSITRFLQDGALDTEGISGTISNSAAIMSIGGSSTGTNFCNAVIGSIAVIDSTLQNEAYLSYIRRGMMIASDIL